MTLSYNQSRFSQSLLSKYRKSPPSFTINFYDDHWTLNKGPSKFLYTQPVSGLLDDVRALRIPVDFIEIFDMANVPYYEGCMIVESIDHRKLRVLHPPSDSNEPETVRVVLQPNAESLYADLCLLNAKNGYTWTDQEVLDVESKILNATCPPLCLDPDVNLTRIVNTVVRASTPAASVSLKRKQVEEPEEDENDKAKRSKLWSQYMHPRNGKPSSQVQTKRSIFDILNEVAQKDEKGTYTLKWKPPKSDAAPFHSQGQQNNSIVPPNAANTPSATASIPLSASQDQKSKLKPTKKADVVETPAILGKGKKNPVSSPSNPAPAPSPVSEQRKVGPVVPGVNRAPVDAVAMATGSPLLSAQFPQAPQPSASPHPPAFPNTVPPVTNNNQTKKKGVLKKSDEQVVQPPTHPSQPLQANPMDPWQTVPSAQYLSQPPPGKNMKKQPVQQPQQTSPFHANASVPGFANNNAFAQNATYKNPGGMAQNLNSNRGSPMTHNQPLLSRDPLPPHSQSPHPAPQQTPQASVTPQHQVPHPSHQFNMHLPQGRFNPGMQGQPGQPMPQHPIPQAHHPQQTAARTAQGPHDPSQAMMHPQMQYGPMAQYPYQHMHMQTMMNGVRMPNMQGTPVAGAQFIPGQWRIPAGRGAGPMTTMPMHNQQFQQQQQQMLAAMSRAQAAQQTQPQGQGR